MKKIIFSASPLILLLSFWLIDELKPTTVTKCPDNSGYRSEIMGIMQNMKTYTLAIAGQMPESKYGFKPVNDDTVRSFGEQFKHLIISLKGQTEDILEGKSFNVRERIKEIEEFEEVKMDKTEILRLLTEAFDKLILKLGNMNEADFEKKIQIPFGKSEPISYRMVTMFIRDHITHHRAQAIVYLRMNRIEPAFYAPY